MSCLEMNNSARISFSNDFVEIRSENGKSNNINVTRSSISKPSVDFEFSVTDYSMIPADEIFLKGKILPLKETSHVHRTLREELLVEEEAGFSLRPIRLSSSTKCTWRELLGLKKAHIRSKKNDPKTHEGEISSLGQQDHKTISGNVSMECQVGEKCEGVVEVSRQ